MTNTPDAEAVAAKLAEVAEISKEIVELEKRLGIDPTHRREPDGLYQRRLRLYTELRRMDVPFPTIGDAADTSGESVRAAMHKRVRRLANPDT